jgi:hypothetical protein
MLAVWAAMASLHVSDRSNFRIFILVGVDIFTADAVTRLPAASLPLARPRCGRTTAGER